MQLRILYSTRLSFRIGDIQNFSDKNKDSSVLNIP